MDNIPVDRSAGGQNFHRRAASVGCRRRAMSSPALPPRAYNFFPYYSSAPPPPGPFMYPPYNFYSFNSLPPFPSNHPGLPPRPPVTVLKHSASPYRTSTLPPRPAAIKDITPTGMVTEVSRKTGEYKRKKPRSTEVPLRAQRRKPLQRAAPLPAAATVTEALDDLENEVTRGFVEDLLHALAPPPSSLPLPTFSLIRAPATKAPPPCAV